MRKTSYFVTFLAVLASLSLNLVSFQRRDWIYSHPPDILGQTIYRYGLLEVCERSILDMPGPGGNGKIRWTSENCREFPTTKYDQCEDKNRPFCTAWLSARYSAALSFVFGAAAALGLVFGVTTHSRRRRVWKAIAGLVVFQVAFKIVPFAIVTDLYRHNALWTFEYGTPSTAYFLNLTSWVADVFILIGIVVTGIAADAGRSWAAGSRAYREIDG